MKYCNEGQETASITVEGKRYLTKNPPMTIIKANYLATIRDAWLVERSGINSLLMSERIIYPDIQDYSIEGISGNDVIIFSYVESGIKYYGVFLINRGEYSLIESFTRPAMNAQNTAQFSLVDIEIRLTEEPRFSLTALDKNQSQFASFLSKNPIPYKINCDECEAGECKGRRARYPGYDCMKCKEMQTRIDNMNRRIRSVSR
ncbi:hypothetical protein NIES4074_23950 [Cylindrospermum sp. NIES-4074]|nr:hypothetical protein NIES4074_23950 [Cylindrospermum sp. NIES-4074]